MIRKYLTAVIAGLLCSIAIIIMCVTVADIAHIEVRAGQEETETTHYTYKVVEKECATETAIEASTETVATIESEAVIDIVYFNVPLEECLQDYIKAECESKGIAPAVVVAIIEKESSFNQYAMGDDGRSFGLMQIQPKWHLQRMIDLNCTDLFNAYQNITVGIDYLAELKDRYGDITKALVAYNRGCYDGTLTDYASEIISRANELERGC